MNSEIIKKMIEEGITVSVMESCTGGLMASTITDVSGSSEIFSGGYVTYSNGAKVKCGVSADIIEHFGVYSKETATEMARACRTAYGTEIGIGITGTLGRKDPSNEDSVPGEAYFCIAVGEDNHCFDVWFNAVFVDRHEMKKSIVAEVLKRLEELICFS